MLLLLGTLRDATLTCELLERNDVDAVVCNSAAHLGEEMVAGAGAVLVAEECLHLGGALEILQRTLDRQPTWSDLPILVLARAGADSVAVGDAVALLGNVTLLERPLRVAALVSVVRTALRARFRQYQIQSNLRTLEEARDAEAMAAQRKDEFLAMLAHELRNPLAPIRTALHVLSLDDSDADRRNELRRMMMRQVDHMVRLVDDLLEGSRLSRGKIELQRDVVDLREAFDRALELSRPLIDGRFALTVDAPSTPLMVDADQVRMAQVFSNLLNNAAKYGRPGGHIRLSARMVDDLAVVTVSDDGMGIEPDLLPHVFDLFAQGKQDATRVQDGLGIGLSLVRSLVQLHGGTVMARSAGRNAGAEFEVRLPLAMQVDQSLHQSAGNPSVSPPPPDARAAMRVMIVDDNRDAATSLAMALHFLGYCERSAGDGAAALALADTFHPDVAILDIGMPGIDGYEVAARLRAHPAHSDIVLIALTGWGHGDDIVRCREAGFDHHIRKPADVPELARLLGELALRTASKLRHDASGSPRAPASRNSSAALARPNA